MANDGTGVIHTTAVLFELQYTLNYGDTIPLHLDLDELVDLLPDDDDASDAVRALLEGVTTAAI